MERSLVEIAVFSGGSISWSEAQVMSSKERETAIKVINKYNKLKSGQNPDDEL